MRIGAYNLTPESTNVNWVSLSLLLVWIIVVVVKKELTIYIYHEELVMIEMIDWGSVSQHTPPII